MLGDARDMDADATISQEQYPVLARLVEEAREPGGSPTLASWLCDLRARLAPRRGGADPAAESVLRGFGLATELVAHLAALERLTQADSNSAFAPLDPILHHFERIQATRLPSTR